MKGIVALKNSSHIRENLWMPKLRLQNTSSDELNRPILAQELLHCASQTHSSLQKKIALPLLASTCLRLAGKIESGTWKLGHFYRFVVLEPKPREIFAPAYPDRLVQHWLIRQVNTAIDKQFIEDSFANRKGKGTHAAVSRLQHFMRQPKHRYAARIDIRSFYPSIHRPTLLSLWNHALRKVQLSEPRLKYVHQLSSTLILNDPTSTNPILSGDRRLLQSIPTHKTLYHGKQDCGLPIGSLSSQFFANVYLNPLDHFIKHQLKAKGYIRYVDDMVLLADDTATLRHWIQRIQDFLHSQLRLQLHPNKIHIQKTRQGLNVLGYVVYPHKLRLRRRSIASLRRYLAYFNHLLAPHSRQKILVPSKGRWLSWHQDGLLKPPIAPSLELLRAMQATLNSYYGLMQSADCLSLKIEIHRRDFLHLNRYFAPADPMHTHLILRAAYRR
ncbi:RNA-directed DNA polymerase [Chromobacterium sp. Panama]|uniref:RNA-directed DNA polymerase n=1 Tax=Chromobacterium sp. Panama TaxID=2161826 RepID=UPI001E2D7342|nr:RNA-directed DNA polymerase [Chromobacterium sp. Panama]